MDHAIEGLQVYFDLAFEELLEEWKSGHFQRLADCPSCKEVNAYREALNVLVKACYLPEYVKDHLIPPIYQKVKEQIEENF